MHDTGNRKRRRTATALPRRLVARERAWLSDIIRREADHQRRGVADTSHLRRTIRDTIDTIVVVLLRFGLAGAVRVGVFVFCCCRECMPSHVALHTLYLSVPETDLIVSVNLHFLFLFLLYWLDGGVWVGTGAERRRGTILGNIVMCRSRCEANRSVNGASRWSSNLPYLSANHSNPQTSAPNPHRLHLPPSPSSGS